MVLINPNKSVITATALLLMISLITAVPAWADYELPRHTINGGRTSSGGNYVLSGAIGQPMIGVMTNDEYAVVSGFWPEPTCYVDLELLAAFLSYWLQSDPDLPANLDGVNGVDLADYSIFASYWLCYCPDDWQL